MRFNTFIAGILTGVLIITIFQIRNPSWNIIWMYFLGLTTILLNLYLDKEELEEKK